jgi:hypothetical protein
MAQDYGIIITEPGVGVDGAALNEMILNTSYVTLKIDTQNPAGFQTLTFSIINNPPEPVGPAQHAYTEIYKYRHGYAYKPGIETLFNVTAPPPLTSYTTPYFLDWCILTAKSVDDYAALYAVADDTWVYYIVDKYNDGFGSPNLLTGTNIDITSHVFLDGVGM